MKIERFEDLEIWQEARLLCKRISSFMNHLKQGTYKSSKYK